MSFWTFKKSVWSCSSQNLTLKAFCLFIQFELIAFFCSYLKNRVQRVFIRGSYSSEGTVKYGVPKGSVLGPVLFCICINDLPLHIPLNSAECYMLAYDTTLHTTGKSLKSIMNIQKSQQLCLDHIWMWYNANHMLINSVINTRQKHKLSHLSLRLSLDGQNIQNATEHHPWDLTADNKFLW